jgi:hypothetical protein
MGLTFEMVGKISLGKDTEKFHPYEEKTYEKSGWSNKTIRFNVTSGDNRHLLQVKAGAFADGHGDVYSYTKGYTNESGTKVKGESIKIPFKDRLTSKRLPEIAEFKKFVFDLEKPNRRYKLEKAAEKVKEGTSLTDEELKDLEIESEDNLITAIEKSKKKRHEFISEWDFVEFIKKVIDSGKYSNNKFFIKGNGDYSYSEDKQKIYENYIPNRIYLASDDAEEYSHATFTILFNQDSFDEMSLEEKNKYYVNGWMMEYDQNRKSNIPVPVTVVINNVDETDKDAVKKLNATKRKFVVEDEKLYEYGCVVNMLNGAQKTEITDDMLTDEQREDLECGLITMDDIRAELGGSVYGDRIQEYQFLKVAKGWSKGRNATVFTTDDMRIKPIESNVDSGEEIENLFEEDSIDEDASDDDDL